MRAERMNKGSISFEKQEVKFILDSNNFVTCAESTVFCQQIRNQIDFLKNQEENPTP
jgi:hypothetical protein